VLRKPNDFSTFFDPLLESANLRNNQNHCQITSTFANICFTKEFAVAEKFDAVILMCSQDTIKKYVPSIQLTSKGGMEKADRARAIITLFADFYPRNAVDQWVKSGVYLSYLVLQVPSLPHNIAEQIAWQDAINYGGISFERLSKASIHGLESKRTDKDHPAYLIMFTTKE
jgi:hypothetical protein